MSIGASPFDRFVGIPFVAGGRSIEGCDCYGLLWLIFRELRGLQLPALTEAYTLPADRKAIVGLIADELEPWRPIPHGTEMTFDGLLMRDAGQVRHIGLVVAPGRVLHVEQGALSHVESYRSGLLKHRVNGFYRYEPHE